ncbi:Tho complex subunit 7-domain-containing protein [Lophiotrema nucula]|uniref:Tho complex subunit 7-domain-containing protein n=1 Tax=Lophiotrema nucula TaxID=690887 RepID=A0A6A5Z7Y4_9PLEO|nr:Tho complex subunit 7-domain-containing protein [Lophiotrema nucula]
MTEVQAFEGRWLPLTLSDSLHNVSRMLNVEYRPYRNIAKRLTEPPDVLRAHRPLQLPSPPPDASAADEEAAARQVKQESLSEATQAWQHDIMNEVSLLDYAILRMEMTIQSNQAERDHYAKRKGEIYRDQEKVRANIVEKQAELDEVKKNLEIQKGYDEQTEKITNSKMLKPRAEQAIAHAKLDEEIADLQQEVQSSKDTWAERRTQFGRIEEEAKEILRMIKDEKEEAERKEGMMKDDDQDGEGATSRGDVSHAGTPRPDGGVTPLHVSQVEDGPTLKVPPDRLAPLSRSVSVAPSPARSGLGDVEMVESGAQSGDAKEDVEESDGIEEGEEEEDDGPQDEMDDS